MKNIFINLISVAILIGLLIPAISCQETSSVTPSPTLSQTSTPAPTPTPTATPTPTFTPTPTTTLASPTNLWKDMPVWNKAQLIVKETSLEEFRVALIAMGYSIPGNMVGAVSGWTSSSWRYYQTADTYNAMHDWYGDAMVYPTYGWKLEKEEKQQVADGLTFLMYFTKGDDRALIWIGPWGERGIGTHMIKVRGSVR